MNSKIKDSDFILKAYKNSFADVIIIKIVSLKIVKTELSLPQMKEVIIMPK